MTMPTRGSGAGWRTVTGSVGCSVSGTGVWRIIGSVGPVSGLMVSIVIVGPDWRWDGRGVGPWANDPVLLRLEGVVVVALPRDVQRAKLRGVARHRQPLGGEVRHAPVDGLSVGDPDLVGPDLPHVEGGVAGQDVVIVEDAKRHDHDLIAVIAERPIQRVRQRLDRRSGRALRRRGAARSR